MKRFEIIVGTGISSRADSYLATLGLMSRSQLKSRGANIMVNGKAAKPSRGLKPGDRLEVMWEDRPQFCLEPEDIPLDILFENDAVLVINKAQGLVTHPGNGNWKGTLVNAVLGYARRSGAAFPERVAFEKDAALRSGDPQAIYRPGIVHRLDKDTSGVIIVAKTDEALAFLAAQFQERRVRKHYLAIVQGRPEPAQGRIEGFFARDPVDRKRFAVNARRGKRALTLYRTQAVLPGYASVSLFPRTGRTHQLRVHMRSLGCPILGDPLYAKRDPCFPEATLMLHAYRLKLTLPGEVEPRVFTAPLPPRFHAITDRLQM